MPELDRGFKVVAGSGRTVNSLEKSLKFQDHGTGEKQARSGPRDRRGGCRELEGGRKLDQRKRRKENRKKKFQCHVPATISHGTSSSPKREKFKKEFDGAGKRLCPLKMPPQLTVRRGPWRPDDQRVQLSRTNSQLQERI